MTDGGWLMRRAAGMRGRSGIRARWVCRSSPVIGSGPTRSRRGRIARNEIAVPDEDSPNILASGRYDGNQGCSRVTGVDGAVAWGWGTPSHTLGDRIMRWQNWKRASLVAGVLAFLSACVRVAPQVGVIEHPSTAPPVPSLKTWTNSLGMKFVRIEPGKFTMGSTDAQLALLKPLFPGVNPDWFKNEQPTHKVRITRPFSLGAHEVTVGQFRRFVEQAGYKTEGEKDGKGGYGWDEAKGGFVQDPKYTWRNPGFPQGDDHPVVLVSWNDAHAFIEWLNATDKASPRYRLPTEAEWEYACRAGTTTLYPNGDDPEKLAAIGNVADASVKRKYPGWLTTIQADDGHVFTAPVGSYTASPWGLHDMIGNVWEWCEDGYDVEYYKKSPADDPPGVPQASSRVIRGGSWDSAPADCRPAYRIWLPPGYRYGDLGFRLAAVRSE
jgi:formylglycine-generating enzyme